MAGSIYDRDDQQDSLDNKDLFKDSSTEGSSDNVADDEDATRELDSEQLENAEADTPVSDDVDEESASLPSEAEEPFVYTGKRGGDGNILMRSRRRRIYMWGLTLLIMPVFGILLSLIIAGPLKLMNIGKMFENFHMGPNQTSSSTTLGRAYEYFRTGNDPSKRNVGYFAEIVSGRIQETLKTNGITVNYDGPTGEVTRRMQSLDIDTSTPQGQKTFDALKAEGFNIPDPPDGGGVTRLDFRPGEGGDVNASARLRRKALNISVDASGNGKVASAISKRLLKARAGVDFHPLKNTGRALNERFEDWKKKRKDERSERHREGADGASGSSIDDAPNEDPDGDGPEEPPDSTPSSGEVPLDEALDVDAPDADVPTARSNLITKLRSSMLGRAAGGTAAVVGILCIVKDIGNEIPTYQHANTVLPMVRVGYEYVAIASQIQAFTLGYGPPPNLDELRMLSEEVDGIPIPEGQEADALSYGNSKPFNNAESIERQNGVAVGGQPAPKDSDVSDIGEKPWIFEGVDNIPLLGAACGLIDGATQAIKKIPIIGWGVNKLEQAQNAIINGGLEAAFNTNIEEVMGAIVSFVSGGAIDIRILAGANLGGVADKGVFLGEKEAAIAKGGGPLSNEQFVALQQDAWETRMAIDSQKSFFARTLDLRDSESVLAQAIIKMPSYRTSDTIYENTATIFSSVLGNMSGLSSIFSQKAKAAAPIPVDYGVQPSGFSLEELEDERFADPYANAEFIEPQLATLNSEYSGCFGTKIDPTTFAMTIEASLDYSKVGAEKCQRGGDTLVRYRMYLLQQVTLRSAACYEGLDEQSCKELGVEGGGPAPATTGGPSTIAAPGLNGYTIPCTGLPTTLEARGSRGDNVDWTGIPDSGVIGTNSGGQPMKVYIREACDQTNVKTIVIGSSIHATENYGQPISFDLLFKKDLPANMRVIAIPEINGSRINESGTGRINQNGVNLNRNYDYRWSEMSGSELVPNSSDGNYRGDSPASEPETQAVVSFMTSLGDAVSLFLVYHDNLNYVGSAGDTSPALATQYRDNLRAGGVSIALGNSGGINIRQKGSLDGWYNQTTKKPTLLLEMPSYSSPAALDAHSEAIIGIVRDGGI